MKRNRSFTFLQFQFRCWEGDETCGGHGPLCVFCDQGLVTTCLRGDFPSALEADSEMIKFKMKTVRNKFNNKQAA